MADNYLEKQFEQYQARKEAWERSKKLGKRTTGKPAARGGSSSSKPHGKSSS